MMEKAEQELPLSTMDQNESSHEKKNNNNSSNVRNNTSNNRNKRKCKLPKLPDNRFTRVLKNPESLMVILTIMAVVFGVLIGVAIKSSGRTFTSKQVMMIGYPGELLTNMLKMLIIPLIVSSLVSGLANLDTRSSGKVGMYAMIYYMTTTLFAVILGIILVVSIHPGNPDIKNATPKKTVNMNEENKVRGTAIDSFLDLFRNFFPENIVQAATQQVQSYYEGKNGSDNLRHKKEYIAGCNVLGLVSFSLIFGACIGKMGERAKVMLDFFNILNEVTIMIVRLIMWYAPFGITFMVISKIVEIDDFVMVAKALALYMATVIVGLMIHLFGTLPLIYFICTRKNPISFFRGLLQAFFTALGTGTSSGTLPITFRCLEENLKIDPRVTRFVLPIGATVNMDGTALYEAVASIFIGQLNGRSMDAMQIVIISLTATLAAVGAASIPSAGLVTMAMVLTAVDLPVEDISVILAVDWFLDRIRTSVNVVGDAYGAGIVDHLCRHELQHEHVAVLEVNLEDKDEEGIVGVKDISSGVNL